MANGFKEKNMMKRSKTIIPVTLLLALSIVLSSCSAGQQVTAKDVIDKMRETMKNTQTSQGVIDLSVDINKQGIETLIQGIMPGMTSDKGARSINSLPDTASATLKVWKQSPDKARVEVEKSSIPDTSGAILVHDGQKVYALDAGRTTVYVGTPDKMMQAKSNNQMAAMMQSMDVEKELDKVLGAADITLAGSEKVGDLDAYKLEIAPKPDAADLLEIPQQLRTQAGMLLKDGTATLWVDKNQWIPLKLIVKHPNIGQFTYTATGIDLNKPIDASQFVLQVPPGAKTVDLDAIHQDMQPQSMTIQQARDVVAQGGGKLLEPTYLPDKSTLVGVSRLPHTMLKDGPEGGAAYMLNYSSPSADFSITQAQGELEKQLGDEFSGINTRGTDAMKQVTVRGVDALAFSPTGGNWTSLIWKEKDSSTWVAIRGKLALDEVLKIAEGLK